MISRKSPEKSIDHKCEIEECHNIIHQTASQRRIGRGRFCSIKHRRLYQIRKGTSANFNPFTG